MKLIKRLICLMTISLALSACGGGESSGGSSTVPSSAEKVVGISTPSTVSVVN